jgi:hypothetical protein
MEQKGIFPLMEALDVRIADFLPNFIIGHAS